MEEQNYILFESYLANDLGDEERTDFEARLENDNELKRSFETYKELSTFVEKKYENEEVRNAFKANLKKISEKNTSDMTTTSKSIRFKPWQYAIAASVVFLIGFTMFQQFNTPSFSDYNKYDPISLTMRGDTDPMVSNAEKAFNKGDFKRAAIYFESLTKVKPADPQYELFHAISLLELNFFDEADAILGNIAEGESAYKYEALWYYALSELKQENYTASANLLGVIPEESDFYKRAQKLLNKLE